MNTNCSNDLTELIQIEKNKLKDQYVVLTFDDETGDLLDMCNEWEASSKETTAFSQTNPCDFVTPVNKGTSITWIGITNKGNQITIQNIVINMNSNNEVLKRKSYSRNRKAKVVVGKVKDKNVNPGNSEQYYLTYTVNGMTRLIDPALEFHDEE